MKNPFRMFSKVFPYEQTLELQESGKLTREDSIMLLELDRRLQDEEHISQFLMMSCRKKTLIQKLVENTSRNGILLD